MQGARLHHLVPEGPDAVLHGQGQEADGARRVAARGLQVRHEEVLPRSRGLPGHARLPG